MSEGEEYFITVLMNDGTVWTRSNITCNRSSEWYRYWATQVNEDVHPLAIERGPMSQQHNGCLWDKK